MKPIPIPEIEDRVLEAAFEAERATGAHEETLAQTRSGVVVRLLRIGAGSALLLVGLVMLVLPGPGWLMVALGLGVLARDVAWAERAFEQVRRRLPSDADGKMSRSSVATTVVVALAASALALWWTTR